MLICPVILNSLDKELWVDCDQLLAIPEFSFLRNSELWSQGVWCIFQSSVLISSHKGYQDVIECVFFRIFLDVVFAAMPGLNVLEELTACGFVDKSDLSIDVVLCEHEWLNDVQPFGDLTNVGRIEELSQVFIMKVIYSCYGFFSIVRSRLVVCHDDSVWIEAFVEEVQQKLVLSHPFNGSCDEVPNELGLNRGNNLVGSEWSAIADVKSCSMILNFKKILVDVGDDGGTNDVDQIRICICGSCCRESVCAALITFNMSQELQCVLLVEEGYFNWDVTDVSYLVAQKVKPLCRV